MVIRHAALQVVAVLPYEGAIRLDTNRQGLSGQSPITTTSTGIHFDERVMANVLPTPFALAACVYEETAHFIVGRRGLPHGADGLSDFLQELFAAYVEMTLIKRHHGDELTGIIGIRGRGPGQWDHQGVAKMIGYELAGEPRATAELANWLDSGPEPDVRAFAERYRAEFVEPSSPDEFAARVVESYERDSPT
jgi:hypothetical protein